MKKVRFTLEVDEHFIRLLQASVQLKELLKDEPKRMDPTDVLAVLVLGEARGATEEQIHARTPLEWRPHIEVVCSERKVTEGASTG